MTNFTGQRRLPLLLSFSLLSVAGCGSSTDGDDDSGGTGGTTSSSYGGQGGHVTATGGTAGGGTGGTTNGAGNGGTAPGDTSIEEEGLCTLTMACPSEIVDEPDVICSLEVLDSASALVYSAHAAVEIRGRSSQSFPKKNYGIELRTASDADNPTNLLGMGKEADWVLDGAWSDRSFMRNRLTYSLFRDSATSRWAPRGRYCELTLNGDYAGIYVLFEKIKRDDDRVNLPEDTGTGDTFIVKQDTWGNLELEIGVGPLWQLVYPNTNVATPTQTQAAQAWLDSLGAAMRSSDSTDISALFDHAALVDWILVEEFSKNVDAYNLSLFFARSGGRAWVIPWDTDLAYGQPTVREKTNESPEGWISNRTNFISKLSTVAELTQALGPRWRQLRSGEFSNSSITTRLDRYQTILTQAALDRNFALWPIGEVDFEEIYAPYSFYAVSSYAEEMAHLRGWIDQRLAWIDANIDSYPTR